MEIIIILVIIFIIAYIVYDNKTKENNYTHRQSTYNQRATSQKTKYEINEDSARVLVDPIETKVVGVTFENRQELIKDLKVGEQLLITRESDNIYDKNAVMVCRKNGEHIGYIKKEIAGTINMYADMVSPFPTYAKVLDIIGDPKKGQSLGVVIEITPPNEGEVLAAIEMKYPQF